MFYAKAYFYRPLYRSYKVGSSQLVLFTDRRTIKSRTGYKWSSNLAYSTYNVNFACDSCPSLEISITRCLIFGDRSSDFVSYRSLAVFFCPKVFKMNGDTEVVVRRITAIITSSGKPNRNVIFQS
jgi:hypothetical protein